jgi:hypothetical protein
MKPKPVLAVATGVGTAHVMRRVVWERVVANDFCIWIRLFHVSTLFFLLKLWFLELDLIICGVYRCIWPIWCVTKWGCHRHIFEPHHMFYNWVFPPWADDAQFGGTIQIVNLSPKRFGPWEEHLVSKVYFGLNLKFFLNCREIFWIVYDCGRRKICRNSELHR